MDLYRSLIFVLTSLLSCLVFRVSGTCSRGEFLIKGQINSCLDCEEDTFMPADHHNQSQCYDCSKINNHTLERVIYECNRTHDTGIVCVSGYFRANGACVVCDSCPPPSHVGQPCSKSNNAICCPDGSYGVIDGRCLKFCGPGEFFIENNNSCSPCLDGQFKSKTEHRDSTCDVCSVANEHYHTEIKEHCNKTHDAVVVCKENYFNDTSWFRARCMICRNCSYVSDCPYEIEPCKDTRNTLCCSSPSMEASEDGICVLPATTMPTATEADSTGANVTCGRNEYLSYRNSSLGVRDIICRTCPAETYQNIDNHQEHTCTNCSDFEGNDRPETCAKSGNAASNNLTIISVVIGILVGVIIIGLVVCICRRRGNNAQRNNRNITGQETEMNDLIPNSSDGKTTNGDQFMPSSESQL